MHKNELRRDPVSGNWTIILKNQNHIDKIIHKVQQRPEVSSDACAYCENHEHETTPEIYAIADVPRQANEPGWQVRVIPEKYPVLQIHGNLNSRGVGIYDVLDGIGAHELVVETPQHGIDLSEFEAPQLEKVLAVYKERFLDLKRDNRFRYVLMHKATSDGDPGFLDHSHSHIIATPITPLLVKEELANARAHYEYKERCLFCDIIRQEQEARVRVVLEHKGFIVIAPFAARAAFQLMILPKRHETFFEWNSELYDLAICLQEIFQKMRAVLQNFDYIMVIHSGPNIVAGKQRGYWKTLEKDFHWHIELTPKVLAFHSFEASSGFQVNPVPPEVAAAILRSGKLHNELDPIA
ncbi:MAG: galactose-1-phosphate uridylyltransferase [candidate division KSB1 bacterium]|nr:galactose-1-phosphate uridylyltransferase [candidate division KSB1 bacterium]